MTLNRQMRPIVLATACLLAAPCSSPSPSLTNSVGCIPPADPESPAAGSLPALVDRADVIVLVKVTKAERTYGDYHDRLGARRLTLDAVEIAKGTAPAQFVVDDGPCPVLAATQGEAFVALLEPTPDGSALQAVGRPTSALRATPARTLPQLMNEIRAVRPLDSEARGLFERYGWTVTAKHDFGEFALPPLSEFRAAAREIRGAIPHIRQPLETYVALSGEVGLDPRPYAGAPVERLSFWRERKPPGYGEGTPFGHVLIAQRRIIAAWVTVFPEGGPFSVRDRDRGLTSTGAPPSFPPPNRFPDGVNIARTYDLAKANSIDFKTHTGRNGTITDPARVRAFAAALDATLPTRQVVWDRFSSSPTRYYLHFAFDESVVSVEYDTEDGLLSVVADGLSVRPGPTFGALVADLR